MAKLTDVQKAAIEAALRDTDLGDAKGRITAGTHGFDFSLNFKGTLTKGDDYEKKPTTSTPWLTVIALFVRRSGIQRELAMQLIHDAMKEAIETKDDKKKSSLLMEETGVAEAKKAYEKEVLAKLKKTKCQGPITSSVLVTEIVEN